MRRVTKIEGERSIRLYRATVNGDTLVQQTQRGIESAMSDSIPVTRDLTNCDPLSSTSFDMWIPLPVVRQALPLFLKGEDIVEPLPVGTPKHHRRDPVLMICYRCLARHPLLSREWRWILMSLT